MKLSKGVALILVLAATMLSSFSAHATQQLSIGESTNVYLNPSLPSGAWITSTSWETNVIGLECSNSGSWGTMITAYGYWDDIATLSCLYTYSYTGVDGKTHVSHGYENYYFTCKGYPISLSSTSLTMDCGDVSTLTFSISGASIGQIPARWITSDESIASVSSSGTYSASVRANQPGYCTITCYSYMGSPVTCSVKVNSVLPTSFSLNPTEASVSVDKTTYLNCVFTPTYATASVTWKTSNASVATVSNRGVVTGIKAGRATITATTENGLTAKSEITVTDKYVNPRGPVSTSFDGAGTSSNPYKIKSAADLRYLADKTNDGNSFDGKYFLQTADIIINPADHSSDNFKSGEVWIPIGNNKNPFKGDYDGGKHYISGLYISGENEIIELQNIKGYGLFGTIGGLPTIENLVIQNSLMNLSGENYCGLSSLAAIVGRTQENTYFYIKNCHVRDSKLIGYMSDVAGIVCCVNGSGSIEKCSNSAEIDATLGGSSYGKAGGIIFKDNSDELAKVLDCINDGRISAKEPAGIAYAGANVYNSVNSGVIESSGSSSFAAGIMYVRDGKMAANIIENCVSCGEILSTNQAAILAKLWAGTISCNNNVYNSSNELISKINYSSQWNINDNNNKACSQSELKSQSTLNFLNSNIYDDYGWSRWVPDANGYPTLEWYPNVAGIEGVFVDSVVAIEPNENIYDINGILVGSGHNDFQKLPSGFYIVNKRKIFKR